jgi:hypothetical protein
MQSFQKLKEDFLAGLNVSVMLTVMETQQSIVETRKTLERLGIYILIFGLKPCLTIAPVK